MDYIALENIAKDYYKDEPSGHDYTHIARVLDYALNIQKSEGGDFDVIFVSALFHDVHRVMSSNKGQFVPPEESLDEVRRLIADCDIDKDVYTQALEVIREHDNKSDDPFMSKELMIIQDADMLDAMGERALSRTYTYCKTHNIPIKNTSVPLDEPTFAPSVNPISMTHYVYRVLIPQVKLLHTDTAKQMASYDMQVLYDFVKDNEE